MDGSEGQTGTESAVTDASSGATGASDASGASDAHSSDATGENATSMDVAGNLEQAEGSGDSQGRQGSDSQESSTPTESSGTANDGYAVDAVQVTQDQVTITAHDAQGHQTELSVDRGDLFADNQATADVQTHTFQSGEDIQGEVSSGSDQTGDKSEQTTETDQRQTSESDSESQSETSPEAEGSQDTDGSKSSDAPADAPNAGDAPATSDAAAGDATGLDAANNLEAAGPSSPASDTGVGSPAGLQGDQSTGRDQQPERTGGPGMEEMSSTGSEKPEDGKTSFDESKVPTGKGGAEAPGAVGQTPEGEAGTDRSPAQPSDSGSSKSPASDNSDDPHSQEGQSETPPEAPAPEESEKKPGSGPEDTWLPRVDRPPEYDRAEALDGLQSFLDYVGLAPGIGEPADIANALISLARGNRSEAILSAGASVPFLGWGSTAAKFGRKAGADDALAKGAKEMAEEGDTVAKEGVEEGASKAIREGSERGGEVKRAGKDVGGRSSNEAADAAKPEWKRKAEEDWKEYQKGRGDKYETREEFMEAYKRGERYDSNRRGGWSKTEEAKASSTTSGNRRRARRRAEKIIQQDPDHPLRDLLDEEGTLRSGRGWGPEPSVEVGHMKSNKALSEGEPEDLVLEDADFNAMAASGPEHSARGGYIEKGSGEAVEIGGVPIDKNTAKSLEKWDDSSLPEGTVEDATSTQGWRYER